MSATTALTKQVTGEDVWKTTSDTGKELSGYLKPEVSRVPVFTTCDGPLCIVSPVPESLDVDTILGTEQGTKFDVTLATIISRIRSDYGAGSDAEADRRLAALVAEIIYPDLMAGD